MKPQLNLEGLELKTNQPNKQKTETTLPLLSTAFLDGSHHARKAPSLEADL